MNTEFFISWRYLLTKRKEKFISLISVISVLGVAIGVMALIVVIAVMTGFDNDLRAKIVGNYSHITVSGYRPISEDDYVQIIKTVGPNEHITGVSPFIQGQVLMKEGQRFFAVGMKGIIPSTEAEVTRIGDYVVAGKLDDLEPGGIMLGKELAMSLGLGVGAEVSVVSPFGKDYKLKVQGIFSSGMYDYDMNLVFLHLKTAQDMLQMPAQIGGVALRLDNMYRAEGIRDELASALKYNYSLRTWTEANQNFFAALKLEKLTMFVILTLVILVASFNIVSTLIVMVVEKTKDIGILKALGFTPARIRRIFILEGIIIGGLGTVLGTAGGITLCWLLKKYQFIKLPQDIYYLDHLPVAIAFWPDIAVIVLAALGIVLISTVYPAGKAAQLKPVEALRYE